jgi:polyphenol oxidase
VNTLALQPQWQAPARVRAACTWRTGGHSRGPFASLNLATHVGDDPEHVQANRAAIHAALRLPEEPQWLQQVHGHTVLQLDAQRAADVTLTADAAVTRLAGLPLAILVADCLPVLLASSDGAVIGAAHAGWRGLAAGVIEATVAAMAGPGVQLRAWLGPCIRQPHFEVGADVRDAFLNEAPAWERAATVTAFARNARGRWQCDLAALATVRLQRVGVTAINDCGVCTFDERAHCFSFRRDGQTGRMAALLWLQT